MVEHVRDGSDSVVVENGDKSDKYGIRAVTRAARVLSVLAGSENPMTLSAIAIGSNLSVATTLRLLRTLEAEGFVQRQGVDDRYLLGFRILQLSQALVRQLDIVKIARPIVTAVRDECNETTGVAMRVGDYWVHVVEVESLHPIRRVSNLNERMPLYAGSTGKVFMAGMTDEELEDYLQRTRLVRYSDSTPASPDRVREEVARTRLRGYAESHNERGEGGAGVAAPIYGHDGRVIAALKINGPANRFTGERLELYRRLVVKGARQLSSALGDGRV